MFSTWGYLNSFGIFQAHYVSLFHQTPSNVSWIVSVQIFLLLGMSSFAGRLFDAGYFRLTIVCGFVMQIAGIFFTSVSKTYWQAFLAQGVCCGIGDGLLWCPTVSLISTWFLKKRAIAIGLTLCGSSVGGVILPVIAQQLQPKIGFAWTVRVIGFILLALFAVVMCLARTRIPPRRSGPLLELAAFRETSYTLFTIGTFLVLWAVYFSFFYVGSPYPHLLSRASLIAHR